MAKMILRRRQFITGLVLSSIEVLSRSRQRVRNGFGSTRFGSTRFGN